jgi:hypothetical protein
MSRFFSTFCRLQRCLITSRNDCGKDSSGGEEREVVEVVRVVRVVTHTEKSKNNGGAFLPGSPITGWKLQINDSKDKILTSSYMYMNKILFMLDAYYHN